MNYKLIHGDALETLRRLPDNSVSAIVTDPPYGLSKEPDIAEVLRHWLAGDDYEHRHKGFMQVSWDSFVPGPAVWREALRVLKPGGHMLAFFGSRTYDMGVTAVRLAGFEVRDQVMWIYGQGFPKNMDVGKAIELKTAPATDDAKQWDGWGTALKPSHEPIVLARKPLAGTVTKNVVQHGTGALNIEACRIETGGETLRTGSGGIPARNHVDKPGPTKKPDPGDQPSGRWPANLIHDGSPEALSIFPPSKGQQASVKGDEPSKPTKNIYAQFAGRVPSQKRGDSGSAARYFYCAKATKAERNAGCGDLDDSVLAHSGGAQAAEKRGDVVVESDGAFNKARIVKNNHPTVKPIALCRHLVRMITPPGGVVLDMFAGSGSIGCAAIAEGFDYIGIDNDAHSIEIATARLEHAVLQAGEPEQGGLFSEASE